MTHEFPARFDAHAIVQSFGGPRGMMNALEEVGYPTNIKRIQKWRERDSIPSHALAALMLYKLRGGERLSLNEYLLEAA